MADRLNFIIEGIQHVGIPVTRLAVSEKFYERLGFKNVMKAGFPSEGGRGTAVMMENNGVILELYEMPRSELQSIRERKDGHIDHIAFNVKDIEIVFNELRSAGLNIENDKPVFLDFWVKGCRYFTLIGPDGERLEFNQIL